MSCDNFKKADGRNETCSQLVCSLSSFIINLSNGSQLISILWIFVVAAARDLPLFCILFPSNYVAGSLLLNSLRGLFWIDHFSFLGTCSPCFLSFKSFFVLTLLFQFLFTFYTPSFWDTWNSKPLWCLLTFMLTYVLLLFFSSFYILLIIRPWPCFQLIKLHIPLIIFHFVHEIKNP